MKYLFFTICLIILAFSIRGLNGNPTVTDLNQTFWREAGPFELSPERGRFALTYSLLEDNSFYFSIPLARFIVPDVGYHNGHYVSLFAPGVSFLVAPGYLLGKFFNASQLGVYVMISLFALLNLLLIRTIAREFQARDAAAWLGGLVFLFATPAYTYAVNLYQHHFSTFLILLSSLILIKTKKIWPLFIVFFLCAMSIVIDYPNLFLMFPIGVSAFLRMIAIKKNKTAVKLHLNLVHFLTLLGVIIPLVFFAWFNLKSYDNPFQLSGTVKGVNEIGINGQPAVTQKIDPEAVSDFVNQSNPQRSALGFFDTRNLLSGFYLHLFSPDRGVAVFAPVLFLGILGLVIANINKFKVMFIGVLGANFVLYSLWGDPWGGWAFGSRYLIPAYAILSVFLAIALTKFGRNWLFLLSFSLLLSYSIAVNSLGAITTSMNPPKIEALPLEALSGKRERYSFDRNWEYLHTNGSKSFAYKSWLRSYLSPVEFYYLLTGVLMLTAASLITINYLYFYETSKH